MNHILSGNFPQKLRLLTVLASVIVYIIVFLLFGPSLGETSGVFFLLPVIFSSLLCGRATGITITILGIPINSIMFCVLGSSFATPTIARIVIFILALIISYMAGYISDKYKIEERNKNVLREQNIQLQIQLNEIKQLRGLLPICMHCKSIRDEDGYWHRVEEYISNHSNAEFTHGICDSCLKDRYQTTLGQLGK